VVAWGDNSSGQCAVPVGLSGIVAISAGYADSLALKSDGTVVQWGDTGQGEGAVPPGLSAVVAIAAGSVHELALKSDGTVVGWGFEGGDGRTTPPADLANVMAIAAGVDVSVALVANTPTVTSATPQQQVFSLIAMVSDLMRQGALNRGHGDRLLARLKAAENSLNAGRTDHACNDVAGFIKAVQDYVQQGTLSQPQAQPLLDAADALRSSLGCPQQSGEHSIRSKRGETRVGADSGPAQPDCCNR
jgi:hypothetical protein